MSWKQGVVTLCLLVLSVAITSVHGFFRPSGGLSGNIKAKLLSRLRSDSAALKKFNNLKAQQSSTLSSSPIPCFCLQSTCIGVPKQELDPPVSRPPGAICAVLVPEGGIPSVECGNDGVGCGEAGFCASHGTCSPTNFQIQPFFYGCLVPFSPFSFFNVGLTTVSKSCCCT